MSETNQDGRCEFLFFLKGFILWIYGNEMQEYKHLTIKWWPWCQCHSVWSTCIDNTSSFLCPRWHGSIFGLTAKYTSNKTGDLFVTVHSSHGYQKMANVSYMLGQLSPKGWKHLGLLDIESIEHCSALVCDSWCFSIAFSTALSSTAVWYPQRLPFLLSRTWMHPFPSLQNYYDINVGFVA